MGVCEDPHLVSSWLHELLDLAITAHVKIRLKSKVKSLMAAMLADAADSSLPLTRTMDSEEVDPATFPSDIAQYLQEFQALFVHGEVLSRVGYTSTTLQHPLVVQVGSNTTCLGTDQGPAEDLPKRCLTMMKI